jgi:hypothetical protein
VKYSRTEPTRAVRIFALFFFYLLILIQDLLDTIKVLEERITAQDAKIDMTRVQFARSRGYEC